LLVEHRSQDAVGYALLAQVNNLGCIQTVATVAILDERDSDVVADLRFGEFQYVRDTAGQLNRLRRRRRRSSGTGGGRLLGGGGCCVAYQQRKRCGGNNRGRNPSSIHNNTLPRPHNYHKTPTGRQVLLLRTWTSS
jgi:hypothetical protein